jgi:hypothetical protein
MNFQGKINTQQLTSILQFLSNDGKTGVLQITKGQSKVSFCLNEGMIIYATGNIQGCFLGSFLKKKGIISDDQLKSCISLAQQEGVSIGKILVNKGYVSVEKLGNIVHAQVEEIILHLLLWGTADFSYRDMSIDTQKIILVEINFIKLILNASRRIDEISFIKKLIPDETTVFRISENNSEKQALSLDANEWRVLRLINSRNDVGELIQKTGYDKYAVYKVLYSFLSTGIIEACSREGEVSMSGDEIYNTVVINYLDILNTAFKFLKDELGQMAYKVMEESRSKIVSPIAVLFDTYHPERPAGQDIQRIKQYLGTYKNREEGNRLFIGYMDQYLSTVIANGEKLLGVSLTLELIGHIDRFTVCCKEQGDFYLRQEMAESIDRMVDDARSRLAPANKNTPAGGFVSLLKSMAFLSSPSS